MGLACRVGGAVLAMGLAASHPTHAEIRFYAPSSCARPEVLALAMDRLRRQDVHLDLVPRSAVEMATTRGDVVLCAISVRVSFYDGQAYREQPATLVEPRYFMLRRLAGGFALE